MYKQKKLRRALVPENSVGVYHVMSRAAFGNRVFGAQGKEVFSRMMRRQACFSGVEILTYCIMDNHFHLLVRVGGTDVDRLTDDDLIQRYRALYGHCKEIHPGQLHPNEVEDILKADGERAVRLRVQLKGRMGNLATFVQELKLRYARWYNRTEGNRGSIWSGRYKSLMVEVDGPALEALAVYIDLNPVRAGLVDDPARYRWSGYGEAVASKISALWGIEQVMQNSGASNFMALYRQRLGVIARFCTQKGKVEMSDAAFREIVEAEGELSESALLAYQFRYFIDGCVLGSEAFVKEQCKRLLPTRSEKSFNQQLSGSVFSLRRLRKSVIS